jgi:hypothetical protein
MNVPLPPPNPELAGEMDPDGEVSAAQPAAGFLNLSQRILSRRQIGIPGFHTL